MTHSPALTLARVALKLASGLSDGAGNAIIDEALAAIDAELAASADAGREPEPFVVRHYTGTDRPIIKGNGFDGLEVGEDREAAEEFVAWINAKLAALSRPAPLVDKTADLQASQVDKSAEMQGAPVSAQGDERERFESWIAKRETPFTNWQLWQAARAQVAQGDEVDAARYRWMRDPANAMNPAWMNLIEAPVVAEEFDAIVDAARAQQGGQG